MPQFDTALNLIWALFCVGAVVYHIRGERRRGLAGRAAAGGGWARASRAVALFVAVVSLFPCVSASDDSFRFEYLGSLASHAASGHSPAAPRDSAPRQSEKSHATVVRMLESLESVQVTPIWALAVMLCFFALVFIARRQSLDRLAPKGAGRDPPAALLLPA